MASEQYTKEVARKVREIKPPYPVHFSIVDRGNFLSIMVYEKEIMEFDVDKRVLIMEYLLKVRDIIQSYGIRCELEGFKYHAK